MTPARRRGWRLTSPAGQSVTVLATGQEIDPGEVSVRLGGTVLGPGSATVEPVEERYGTLYSMHVATLIDRYSALTREACRGVREVEGVPIVAFLDAIEIEVARALEGDDAREEARVALMVCRARVEF